jgi:ribosome maturation factor RimP
LLFKIVLKPKNHLRKAKYVVFLHRYWKLIEGDTRLSPCFLLMSDVIEQVSALLEPLLEGTDIFLVNIKLKPTNNIKVFLDADGGMSIDKCAKINKRLYHAIEDEGLFPDGDFSLEVSSPGVDEPLLSQRQYKRNIGRTVAVTTEEGVPEKLGVLKTVEDDRIVLEVKIPKKKETTEVEIPTAEIKKIVVQIVF